MGMIKLSKIKPNEKNPRFVKDEKFEKLCKSIESFAEKMMPLRPIVIDENNIILGGNMRFKALKHLGYKEIPSDWIKQANDLTEEEKNEFIIKDNVGFGDWDWEVLANEWNSDELEEWGLDIPNFEPIEELEAVEDDYQDPEQMQVDVVLGDLIEIGEHRLLCGDSTDSDAVARLMNGEKADLAHNDPPYGMKKENVGVIGDNMNFADLLNFNLEWIALQFTHIKENGSWYCWGTDEPLMDIYSEIIKPYISTQKATFRNLITWNKGNGQGQNSDNTRSYAIADEKCLFAMMGVQSFEFERNELKYNIVFETLRLYFENERIKSGLSVKDLSEIDSIRVSHYWAKSQWEFPTKEAYQKIKNYCVSNNIQAFKKEYEQLKKEYEQLKKEYYSTRAYFNNVHDNFNNVWKFERHLRQGDEGGHATPKPIPLCERVIKSSCPDGGLVLDFFLGSGSTMVASHQLKRKCYGMELAPKYCQVIIDRMQKLDSSLVVKINGIEYKKATSEQVPF